MASGPIQNVLPREIYKIRYIIDASEIERYVLVVSREGLNKGRGCIVVPFTSQEVAKRSDMGNCVPFLDKPFGLRMDCVAKCEDIQYSYYDEFMQEVGRVGVIDDDHWESIVLALGDVFQASCEPALYS